MKRSCSAPDVPKLLQRSEPKPIVQTNLSLLSKRGLSNSNMSLPGDFARPELSPKRQPLSSPLPLSRINSPTSRQHRVAQIKKEETLDERANEREVQEQIQLNKTWDDSMKLHTDDQEFRGEAMEVWSSPAFPNPPPSSYVPPSSPLTSKMMRSRSLTPTSPSATRNFSSYRRSCSPVLRPSSLCFGQKRKREYDSEDMETSPTIPCKKQQLGYASPYNLSPCVSPLMGNSPLHHSFSTTSRKSSTTQSESTPLSSPSSVIINPFAVKYDSGNCDHWQSLSGSTSGSTCSSTGHSPSVGNTPTNLVNARSISGPLALDEVSNAKLLQGLNVRHMNGSQEGVVAMDSGEVITETSTPLSPRGLQFRQKPFPLSVATLPSPIPRPVTDNNMDSSFNHVMGSSSSSHHNSWISPNTSPVLRSQPNSPTVIVDGDNRCTNDTTSNHKYLHYHTLQHDRHLSPFNSDVHGHNSHTHPPRIIKPAKTRLQKSILGVSSSRQMIRPEPQRPSSVSSIESYIGRSGSAPSVLPSSSRLVISSPLAKLSMSSSLDGEHLQGRVSPGKGTLNHRVRTPIKRRMSDVSTDSQEDSFMESDDSSVVGSFEETLPTSKVVRTIS